jgi:hypothetical protein
MTFQPRLALASAACLALAACGGSDPAVPDTQQRAAQHGAALPPLVQLDTDRIGAGATFAAGLATDGKVYAWGDNGYGQLGQGHLHDSLLPVPVRGMSGVSALAVGDFHTLAMRRDGTVWGWGSNHYGQLGLGKAISGSAVPVPVAGLSSVRALAANNYLSLALRHDGSVWAWGRSGSRTTLAPAPVPGMTGAKAVAAGWDYALAVRNDGTVWGWGSNSAGQLGKRPGNYVLPTRIEGIDKVVTVSASMLHALALRMDGSVWTWGTNTYGQMGIDALVAGPTRIHALPMPSNGASGVRQIAAGAYNSAVLYSDGSVWSWGSNHYGQVADGTIATRTAPVRLNTIGNVVAMAVSDGFVIFLQADGTAQGAGANGAGALGNNTRSNSLLPMPVLGLSGTAPLNLGSSRAH